MREFTRIAYNPSKGLVLKWQTAVKGEDDEGYFKSGFESQQVPHEGFLNALKALAPDIPVHCDLPEDWYKERISILGVNLSYNDAGLNGASIQAKIGLHSGSTISINGPQLKVSGEAHERLEEECVFRLRNLVKEAEKVLKAVASKQAELFPASLPESNGKPAQAKAATKVEMRDNPANDDTPKARKGAPAKGETSQSTPKAKDSGKKTEAKDKAKVEAA